MNSAPFTRRSYGKPKRGIIFYFCGWKTPMWLYWPVFFIANRVGYKVVAYAIAESNIEAASNEGFMAQLGHLIIDIRIEIDASILTGVSFFACFGSSLGSELALAATKQIPQISAAILNTVRGSTSDFLWHAPYAKHYKRLYEDQGYTEAKLYNELKAVEAGEGLSKLKKRPVLLYYSLADTVIPPRNTKILMDAMDAEQSKYQLVLNKHLNHFLASTKNNLFFWRWTGFLSEVAHRERTNS